MAYCVHCGVKLDDAEKCCPLCNTSVFDPSQPDRPTLKKDLHPHSPEQKLTISKKYWVSLLLLTMMLPAALCLVVNLLLEGRVTWSAYPSSALTILFLAVLVPIMANRYKLRWSIFIDSILLALYIYICEQLSETPGWFFPIALPTIALLCALALLFTTLYTNKKMGKLSAASAAFLSTGLLCTLLNILLSLFNTGAASLDWAIFVLAPCLFIAALLLFIGHCRPLKEELMRRMHF